MRLRILATMTIRGHRAMFGHEYFSLIQSWLLFIDQSKSKSFSRYLPTGYGKARQCDEQPSLQGKFDAQEIVQG